MGDLDPEQLKVTQAFEEHLLPHAQALSSFPTNKKIPDDLASQFLCKIPLEYSPSGVGSRSGAKAFRCLWLGCNKEIKRRDHSLNHIRQHVGSRPYECCHWYVTIFPSLPCC